MNNQINPNLKTLSQLMSKSTFIDYFATVDDMGAVNIFDNTNDGMSFINPIANIYYAMGANKQSMRTIVNLLSMLYDIFADAIPYNQNMSNVQLAILSNSGVTPTTMSIPLNLLRNIKGYITAYMPSILSWSYGMYRMMIAQQKVLDGTRQVTKSQGISTVSQNQNISKNSFNPVDNTTNITTNKITVNKQSNGGLQTEQFTANGSANWSTDTNGSSAEVNRNETITEYDLTQLRELGSEKAIQYLMPLFRKIGTLFWCLGNDYWNEDNGTLGFHIW